MWVVVPVVDSGGEYFHHIRKFYWTARLKRGNWESCFRLSWESIFGSKCCRGERETGPTLGGWGPWNTRLLWLLMVDEVLPAGGAHAFPLSSCWSLSWPLAIGGQSWALQAPLFDSSEPHTVRMGRGQDGGLEGRGSLLLPQIHLKQSTCGTVLAEYPLSAGRSHRTRAVGKISG